MNVYVSKSNTFDQEVFQIVVNELDENINVTYHDPSGKYDPSKIENCDVIIGIMDDGQAIIGRGQYGELTKAAAANKKVYIVSVHDGLIRVNSLEEIRKLDDANWKVYAHINYEFLADYDLNSGAFVDFIENAP